MNGHDLNDKLNDPGHKLDHRAGSQIRFPIRDWCTQIHTILKEYLCAGNLSTFDVFKQSDDFVLLIPGEF